MQEPIVSLQNDKVKDLVKLRQRKSRDNTKLMIIDGLRSILMAIKNGFAVKTVYHVSEKEDLDLGKLAEEKNVLLQPVSKEVFDKVGYGDNPDGFLGLAEQPNLSLDNLPSPADPFYVIAEGLEKPGNLGAILRSADAAGITGIIICDSVTDIYNPNVIRSSIGTFFSVPIAVADKDDISEWIKKEKLEVYTTVPGADKLYTEIDLSGPCAVVIGSEHSGVSEHWLSYNKVSIPMCGQADSINAAQTATVLMFEALRQRK